MDERFQIVRTLALGGIAGHQQDAGLRPGIRNLQRERDAVHARHDDVREKQVERVPVERFERGESVVGGRDLMPGELKGTRHELAHARLVFRDQYLGHLAHPLPLAKSSFRHCWYSTDTII